MSNGQKTKKDLKQERLRKADLLLSEKADLLLSRIEIDPLKVITQQLDRHFSYEDLRILMACFDCSVDKVAIKILKHKRGHKQF